MDLKFDYDNSRLEKCSIWKKSNQVIFIMSKAVLIRYPQIKYPGHLKIHVLIILNKIPLFSFICLMLSEKEYASVHQVFLFLCLSLSAHTHRKRQTHSLKTTTKHWLLRTSCNGFWMAEINTKSQNITSSHENQAQKLSNEKPWRSCLDRAIAM